VSGLAHQFEAAGLGTTLIALVRDHAERIRPPRALWVPFELGRPFGEPGDDAFQLRVLRAALALFDQDSGPVLQDFEDEAPGRSDDPDWTPPFSFEADVTPAQLAEAFRQEVDTLTAMHDAALAAGARTTIGASGLNIPAIGGYLLSMLNGETPDNPRPDSDARDAIRAVMEDLKAACQAVAIAGPGRPSSRQLADWLWGETASGALLLQLARQWQAGGDKALKIIGSFVTVPGSQAHRL
jgi:hypothetical protein